MKPFKFMAFLLFVFFYLINASVSLANMENVSSSVNEVYVVNEQPQVPVLCMKPENIVLRIKVQFKTSGKRDLSWVNLNLNHTTNLFDIQNIKVYYIGSKPDEKFKLQFGVEETPSEKMQFNDKITITDNLAFFEVAVTLKTKVDLLGKINVACESVCIDSAIVAANNADLLPGLRLGIALRQHDNDQVDTYRIPGLATSVDGTLLAIYDVRRENSSDLQGDIDIGLSRSTNHGNTWEPMRIVLDRGEWGGLPQKYNGISDPCILVDQNSKKIFVAALWMYGVLDGNGKWIEGLNENTSAWSHPWLDKGSQPGSNVKQTAQFLITQSTDDGKSWSDPINITSIKRQEWWLFAPAPGHGITLDDGTLVFPTQGRDENGVSFSNIMWSKDNGETWHASNIASNETSENMAVQLNDGRIMLNTRSKKTMRKILKPVKRKIVPETNKSKSIHEPSRAVHVPEISKRKIFTTSDLGECWDTHSSSNKDLVDPECMACLHRHVYTGNGNKKSILIFSNPNTRSNRNHITIKVSFDEGKTWPEKYWILLDEGSGWGYSCITSIDEQTIGILYESSMADLVFQKISLNELIRENK